MQRPLPTSPGKARRELLAVEDSYVTSCRKTERVRSVQQTYRVCQSRENAPDIQKTQEVATTHGISRDGKPLRHRGEHPVCRRDPVRRADASCVRIPVAS